MAKQGSGREPGRPDAARREGDRALYIISVAAELAGVHPQTLRIYERKGLLTPARTPGNTRRYSDRDIARLQMIQRLTQEEGLNLAGVKMIVEMEDEIDRMRRRVDALDKELQRARDRMRRELERFHREYGERRRGDIVRASELWHVSLQPRSSSERPRKNERSRGPIVAGPVTSAGGSGVD